MSEHRQTILDSLIAEFAHLPGLGPKSARRIAYCLLERPDEKNEAFASLIADVKKKTHHCPDCGAWTEEDKCEICSSTTRDLTKLCIVESPSDIPLIEEGGLYKGVYHVLFGTISPMRGVMPENLNIASLAGRIERLGVKEIIFALNPTEEGDVTSIYIKDMLSQFPSLEFSRISSGVPTGGDLEYAATRAIYESFQNRRKF